MKPSPLSFRREDIPDLSTGERTDRLLRGLNTFGADAERLLDGGLTFKDNLAAFAKKVEFTAQAEWENLTVSSPWTAGGTTPQIRKRGVRVELRGAVDRNTATTGSTIFTIASKYRPSVDLRFSTSTSGTPETHRLLIQPSGTCVSSFSNTPATVYLDGAAWDATDSTGGTNGVFPIRIRNDLKGGRTPTHAWITRAMDYTDGGREVPAVLGPVAWSLVKDQVQIDDVGGVLAGRKYRLTLLVVAE